ncbi:class I SAM-dependent methyltransferase [Patescibacteria group bacterium]
MEDQTKKFGIEKIPLVLNVDEIAQVIYGLLVNVLANLEVDAMDAHEISALCIQIAKQSQNVIDYERSARELFEGRNLESNIQKKFKDRAKLIQEQVLPHLLFPGNVLDLGCGDGGVGKLIAAKGFDVQLADVYEHPQAMRTGLKHDLLKEGERLPYEDGSFYNIILALVLHHSDDPDFLLREAKRILKPEGKIILIESEYGIKAEGIDAKLVKEAEFFLNLNDTMQRFSNAYFDHLYNRILHYSDDPSQKVNVPCNFDTPEGWKQRIEKAGLEQEKFIQLGLDHPIVPEWHTLRRIIHRTSFQLQSPAC